MSLVDADNRWKGVDMNDFDASAVSEDLFRTARAAWRLTLIGDAPPHVVAMRERMQAPQPGDVVIEVSTFSASFDPDRLGILSRILGDGRYVVHPYHNQGIEQTWENADFVAAPCRGEGWPK